MKPISISSTFSFLHFAPCLQCTHSLLSMLSTLSHPSSAGSAFLCLFALSTRFFTLSFPPNLLSSLFSASSTFLPPAPPLLSSPFPLLLHSFSYTPPAFLSSHAFFSLHLLTSHFLSSPSLTLPCTPFSFPSTCTPLLSSPSSLLLPKTHSLLHSFTFTPPPSVPTYASLLSLPSLQLPYFQLAFSLFPSLTPPSGLPSFPQPPSSSLF